MATSLKQGMTTDRHRRWGAGVIRPQTLLARPSGPEGSPSTIVAVGILYSYRGSPFVKDKRYLLYGLGSLFIMGLGIRAMIVGLR